jgi:hypothetical protein
MNMNDLTPRQAMMLRMMAGGRHLVKIPITRTWERRRLSQTKNVWKMSSRSGIFIENCATQPRITIEILQDGGYITKGDASILTPLGRSAVTVLGGPLA